MENNTLFKNLSPLDHRYYLANRELFTALQEYLSEEATIIYSTKVETALLKTHIDTFLQGNARLHSIVDELIHTVTCEEVYAEEEKTQHNIKALVNVLSSKLPEELKPYVHLGATSVDILDTATALRMRDAVRNVVLPLLLDVQELLIDLTEEHAQTPQMGRTHGQLAVPVTVGFAFAEYTARLGKSIIRIDTLSADLRGQLSGAVGAFNATSLLVPDPFVLEKTFCSYLDLLPSEYSNQLVEPEYLLRLLLEINIAFGIVANLADDLRHLQRSEIGEVHESFGKKQVGSSTMPHKRNPWNSEHIKSLWKAFAPRVLSFYFDQISEHQRDLTNSASARFVVDYVAGFVAAVNRMKKVLSKLSVDNSRCMSNITGYGDLFLSEAAYILLSVSGETGSHEILRRMTLECEKEGKRLVDQLQSEPDLWKKLSERLTSTVGIDAETFFTHPELYRGKAIERALAIAEAYREKVRTMREVL